MRRSVVVTVAAAILVGGCYSLQIPEEIRDSPRRSIYGISCTEPYALTIGCGKSWLTTIQVEIDGNRFYVASTADGHVVLIGDSFGHAVASADLSFVTLGSIDPEAKRLANALKVVQQRLAAAAIRVLQITVITNFGEVDGYLVETDGDAMTALGATTTGQ
ncbi:MAG: hypothetical protein MUO39_03280 [Steroidobacteraceae bacterium]|nr:hypothetical protein [Steroidobacteraceae bacterium]